VRRNLLASVAVAVGLVLGAGAAHAATPPAVFGSDWDDPRTAAPTVERPAGPSCTVRIVDERFDDYTPYTGSYTPPAACAGPWQKVVLRLDGAVAGRQYDRLGYLRLGDVTIFKTSTPEPSVDGIRWSVEKDVTSYAALLARPQPVEMLIGNYVNDIYTGVLDVQVDLTFYPAAGAQPGARQAGAPQPGVADGPTDVLPLANPRNAGTSLVGEVTVPRNTERLVAEVYATGSGGGCEEFWYLTTPSGAPYSCPADNGPYREVQVRVDGQLAGIAAPYPHVYTGGWSNPFLWYVIPAPRAFDIQPIRYDLTPFAGQLTDGRAHTVEVSVVGVPAGQSGWDVPTSLLAWRDPGRTQVTGGLISRQEGALTNNSTYRADDPGHVVRTTGGHRLTVAGYLDTSHGRVRTTVDRTVGNRSTHRWTDGETTDALAATWTDDERITVAGRGQPVVTSADRRYVIDGEVTIDAAARIRTTITLTDAANRSISAGPDRGSSRLDDTYQGDASWLTGVPRDQRAAVGTSSERYRRYDSSAGPRPDFRYDRTIATRNGYLTQDTQAAPQ
jgi:hypothetical protein